MLAESKHLDFLQQCLCSLGDRLLFQLHYCFAIERLLFTFPGSLLWKLSNVPSLAVLRQKYPLFGRGLVMVVEVIFPELFKVLMFKATVTNYAVLRYQTEKTGHK